MKKLLMVAAAAVLLLVAAVVLIVRAERAAADAAFAYCDAVPVGSPVGELDRLPAGERRYDRLVKGEGQWLAIFSGAFPFSRHICEIRIAEGRVAARSLVYMD